MSGVREAYDALAPAYDLLTGRHDHAAWAAQLERLALDAGLSGRRLLDIGCGTGSSALPMLARGYEVAGVDVSPGMLSLAREKLGPEVRWELADELMPAFDGFRRNLAPGGLAVFDVDTLASFRMLFSSLIVVPGADRVVVLEGQESPELEEGASAVAHVECLELDSPPWWRRTRSVHRQRHHPPEEIERALAAAGMRTVAVWGTDGAGGHERPLDEERHNKAVYIARAERR